ncbi:virion component [Staphylococcus virus vB_SurM-PSU5]|nr:virion component [Staphylococcus virus vB_SurM-PSU5]
MKADAIVNTLLNIQHIGIREHDIKVTLEKGRYKGVGCLIELETSVQYRNNYKLQPSITISYESKDPKEIMTQIKDKVLKIVEEQIKIDDLFIESIKDINKETALRKLKPFINEDYYSMFKASIDKEVPIILPSELLDRCTGKTATMAYLAVEYDLPLVVSNSNMVRMLLNDYPNIKVTSKKREGYKDSIVLVDEPNPEILNLYLDVPGCDIIGIKKK